MPALWLLAVWFVLLTPGPATLAAAAGVLVTCLAQPALLWRFRIVWLATGGLLALAWLVAFVFFPEEIRPEPYLALFAVVLAPVGIARFIDGFWICGWLTRLRCPSGGVMAIAAAIGTLPLILDDVQALVYQRRRIGERGGGSLVGLLISTASGLLEHVVNLEIAFEMYGMFAVFQRWKGRPVQASEWLFLLLLGALAWAWLHP